MKNTLRSLQEYEAGLKGMLNQTQDEWRKEEICNLQAIVHGHIELILMCGQEKVEGGKRALEIVRQRVVELINNPQSAGMHERYRGTQLFYSK